ncbi:MAG: T9SS type A sorting domain-containing protein, partial [Balneolales bacterium]
TITITTDQGTLSTNTESGQTSVTADDEEDGAYTATLTSSSEIGTAQVQALESGNPIASVQVDFTAGDVDAFVVTVPLDNGSPEVQTAGVSFNITVEAVDQNGNRVESYSGTLQFSTNSEISSGGTPSISNGLLENHSITLVKSGDAVTLSAEDPNLFGVSGTSQAFQVVAAAPDVTTSNVTASPSTMQNDGTSQSVITVILHDQFSNRVLTDYLSDLDISAEQIEVNGTPSSGPPDASLGNLSFNAGDANYQATLSSSSTVEKVEITVTFESVAFNQKPLVNIVVPNTWQPSGAPQQRKDWTRDANWSLGSEPGPNDFVIIPGGLADYPDLDLNITIGSLEIQENGELILFGGNSIDVAGAVLVNGSFNIEKNTSLTIGSGFTGSGTFVTGESAEIEIGGNLSIANFLARTSNTIVRLNGSSQQTISSTHMLAQRLEIQNIVVAASGNLIDLNRLIISEENTFSLQNSADITIDINSEISGGGAFTLNDNTLVMRGNIELSNIDASEGTVIFGIRLDEDFADFPGLTQQQVSNLSAMKNVVINNTHGVLTFEDVFVDGSLTLENGPLIISSGKSLIAPDQTYNNGILRFRRTINSVPGWRMISSPAGSTYSDLFDGLTLQGLSGSAFEDRQPNLFYYDETADTTDLARWRAPAATGDNIQAGRGYFFYVFGNPEDTDYNDILPKTLTVSGEENQPQNSHFAFNVSLSDAPAFDPETDDRFVELAEKGWNLIGNPFGATINWDDEANWIRENIDDVIYIWKTQDAGGGQISGDYLVWNGDTGSLGNGLITPFQAFWVKANDEAPELEIHPSAKTTGGQFRQKSRPAESYQIILSLEADSLHTTTYLNFSDVADPGLDSRDAYLLEPMSDTFLNFYSVARSRTSGQIIDLPLIINHLPHRSEQAYDIPLGVRGYREGEPVRGEYTVRLDPESSFPDHWEVRLKNNVTGETIRLRNDSNTAAKASGQSSNMSSVQEEKQNGENIDGSTGPEVSAHIDHFPGLREQRESTMKFMDRSEPVIADIGSRDIAGKVSQSAQPIESNNSNKFPFTIYVIPDDLEEGDIPQRVFLDQNYPNPFNPSTTVRYGIPRDGQVRLDVYDVLGRRVQTLADGRLEAGVHTASFDGTRLASGVYIYRLQTPQRVITRKMMLLK